MSCSKCSGLMVKVPAFDHAGISVWLWLWRCMICGNYTDEICERNRRMRPEPSRKPVARKRTLERAFQLFKGGK